MTIVDILLLEILRKSNDEINANKIHNSLVSIEISYAKANIHRKLNNLELKNLIVATWKKGNKFYSISPSGKKWLDKLKNQLREV